MVFLRKNCFAKKNNLKNFYIQKIAYGILGGRLPVKSIDLYSRIKEDKSWDDAKIMAASSQVLQHGGGSFKVVYCSVGRHVYGRLAGSYP